MKKKDQVKLANIKPSVGLIGLFQSLFHSLVPQVLALLTPTFQCSAKDHAHSYNQCN